MSGILVFANFSVNENYLGDLCKHSLLLAEAGLR